MIQFDEHIFQRGWFNHQLDTTGVVHRGDDFGRRMFLPSSWFPVAWSRVVVGNFHRNNGFWWIPFRQCTCALKTVGVFWWKRSWSWNPVDFGRLRIMLKFPGSYSWFIFQPRKGCCTGVDRIGSNLFPQLLVSVLFLVLNTCDLVDIYCLLDLCSYGNTMVFVVVVIFRSRLLLPEKKNKQHDKIIAHGIAWYIYLHLFDYCGQYLYIYK